MATTIHLSMLALPTVGERRIEIFVVVDAGEAEAEDLQKVRAESVEVGERRQILGR